MDPDQDLQLGGDNFQVLQGVSTELNKYPTSLLLQLWYFCYFNADVEPSQQTEHIEIRSAEEVQIRLMNETESLKKKKKLSH